MTVFTNFFLSYKYTRKRKETALCMVRDFFFFVIMFSLFNSESVRLSVPFSICLNLNVACIALKCAFSSDL